MQVNYSHTAFQTLAGLVNYIESFNTEGAGLRWLLKFEKFLVTSFSEKTKFSICNNKAFQQISLQCIYYKDWILAFSVQEDSVLIEAILHKSRITD